MNEDTKTWRPKFIGAGLGLALALTVFFGGVLTAFLLASFVTGGWLMGKYAAGEIDLRAYYERYWRDRFV